VTNGVEPTVVTSVRNLPDASVTPANQLNARDTHRAINLVITRDAVMKVDEIWSSPVVRPVHRARAVLTNASAEAVR
jgi:hypothetical protein